jgi:hypothetical protein
MKTKILSLLFVLIIVGILIVTNTFAASYVSPIDATGVYRFRCSIGVYEDYGTKYEQITGKAYDFSGGVLMITGQQGQAITAYLYDERYFTGEGIQLTGWVGGSPKPYIWLEYINEFEGSFQQRYILTGRVSIRRDGSVKSISSGKCQGFSDGDTENDWYLIGMWTGKWLEEYQPN